MRGRVGIPSHKLRSSVIAVVMACCVIGIVTVGSAERVSDSHGPTANQVWRALADSIRFSPRSGAKNVPPDTPIRVASKLGHINDVRVTDLNGAVVPGAWDAAASRWKPKGSLLYGGGYRITASVSGAANLLAQASATFHALSPTNLVTASVYPTTGMQVGVGQPIVITFSQPIPVGAQARLARHIIVATTPHVGGGWHWFNDHELHFRPKALWPAGTQVTVVTALSGWHVGGDLWGDGFGGAHFAVGDSRVSIANLATFTLTVTLNGRVVATYPMSGGKPTDPTMGGTHIVLDRQTVVRMNSATNGVPVNSPDGYDELVYNDVHISDSGEYVHAAPWSTGSQGNRNVSHGCINLSPANAAA